MFIANTTLVVFGNCVFSVFNLLTSIEMLLLVASQFDLQSLELL